MSRCPDRATWLRLVDGEVTANRMVELRGHAARCAGCADQLTAAERLIASLARPRPAIDAAAMAARVMAAIDDGGAPARARTRARPSARAIWFGAGGVALAAAAAIVLLVGRPRPTDEGTFAARGGSATLGADAVLARHLDIRILTGDGAAMVALADHPQVGPDATFAVAVRNLVADRPVFALVFAVDALGETHWLYPGFSDPASDPTAIELPRALREARLAEAVAFEDLAPGPGQIVAVVAFEPHRVLEVEAMAPARRTAAGLAAAFPRARVLATPMVVSR